MKNLVTSLATSPVTSEIGNVIDTLLNHSARMKQLDNDYLLQKQQMDFAYKIEIQKIEKEMSKFKEMIALYSQNSKNKHLQQMSILDKAQELMLKIFEVKDTNARDFLNTQIDKYLSMYEKNNTENSNNLQSISSFRNNQKLLN